MPGHMPTPKQIAEVLKRHAETRGLTQEKVAEILDISVGQANSFLNGRMVEGKAFRAKVELLRACLELDAKDLHAEAFFLDQYGLESASHCIFLGDYLTLWYSRVGDGTTPIKPENIDLIYDPGLPIEFPAQLERLASKVLTEHAAGKHEFANNPVLTIVGGETSAWRGSDEEFYVKLEFGATDYAHLYALRQTSDGKKLLRDYVRAWSPDILFEPVTGQGFGVNVVVVSRDEKLAFGRRSAKVGARKLQLDVGTVEGFSLKRDIGDARPTQRCRFDAASAARGAMREELGIGDDDIEVLEFLNLGFDLQYAQWNLIAIARSRLTSIQIRNRHRTVAPQGIEYSELIWADGASPRKAFELVSNDEQPFWSCGLAAIFYAFVRMHGIAKVEEALDGVKFRPPDRFVWG